MMITTVIFDIGRVLARFEWREYLESFGFSEEVNDAIAQTMFLSKNWAQVDLGILTDEEVLQAFIQDAPRYAKEITEVFKQYPTSITLLPYTMDWIRSLQSKGLKVYYLSNYGKTTKERTISQLPFLDIMDGGLMSYQVQMIKPDPAFYRELFRRYGIIPQQAVFLDDNEDNIAAGKALGLHTILFTDYESASQKLHHLIWDGVS